MTARSLTAEDKVLLWREQEGSYLAEAIDHIFHDLAAAEQELSEQRARAEAAEREVTYRDRALDGEREAVRKMELSRDAAEERATKELAAATKGYVTDVAYQAVLAELAERTRERDGANETARALDAALASARQETDAVRREPVTIGDLFGRAVFISEDEARRAAPRRAHTFAFYEPRLLPDAPGETSDTCATCGGTGFEERDATGALGYLVNRPCEACGGKKTSTIPQRVAAQAGTGDSSERGSLQTRTTGVAPVGDSNAEDCSHERDSRERPALTSEDAGNKASETIAPRGTNADPAGAPKSGDPSGWRVGRRLGRTLYRAGVCVGMVDSEEIAREIVEAMKFVDWREKSAFRDGLRHNAEERGRAAERAEIVARLRSYRTNPVGTYDPREAIAFEIKAGAHARGKGGG